MSTRCQYCGAPDGKSHTCAYGPGGKHYKAPAQKKPAPPPTVKEIAAIPCAPISLALEREIEMPKKRAAKASELQAKADGVKLKAPRPQSRAGKRAATVWLTPGEMKRLQHAALDHGVPQERILAEGLAAMLNGKYKA